MASNAAHSAETQKMRTYRTDKENTGTWAGICLWKRTSKTRYRLKFDSKGRKRTRCFRGERSRAKPQPQMHFGRIESPKNASNVYKYHFVAVNKRVPNQMRNFQAAEKTWLLISHELVNKL